MKSSGVWILAEQKDGKLQRISFELLTRGLKLSEKTGSELSAMIFSSSISEDELGELIERGADRVVCIESPHLAHAIVRIRIVALHSRPTQLDSFTARLADQR